MRVAETSGLHRLGLGQTEVFFFRDAAVGAQHVDALVALHDITDLADLAADAKTRMLGHFCYLIYLKKQFIHLCDQIM